MLYNFQIKFNSSNENETFDPYERFTNKAWVPPQTCFLSLFEWQPRLRRQLLPFQFEEANCCWTLWCFQISLTMYLCIIVFFSSTTFIIDETALFFVRRLYEFLRLWLGEFLPEGGEHVHQVPGVDAAVVILVKNPAPSPWSITALQIICHKHSDWGIEKLKPAPSRIFPANNY